MTEYEAKKKIAFIMEDVKNIPIKAKWLQMIDYDKDGTEITVKRGQLTYNYYEMNSHKYLEIFEYGSVTSINIELTE